MSHDGVATTLSAHLDETYTDGFIVLKHGAVVHESYFNGMTARSLHLSQSMAKSVTATVCGILVGRGLIDTTRPVTRLSAGTAGDGLGAARPSSTCST